MKTVTFAKRWVYRPTETSKEIYAAGSTADVSEDRAKAAHEGGFLKTAPVDAKQAAAPVTPPAKTKGA